MPLSNPKQKYDCQSIWIACAKVIKYIFSFSPHYLTISTLWLVLYNYIYNIQSSARTESTSWLMFGQAFWHWESSPTRTSQSWFPLMFPLHVVGHPVVALEAAHTLGALVVYVLVPHVLGQLVVGGEGEVTGWTRVWKWNREMFLHWWCGSFSFREVVWSFRTLQQGQQRQEIFFGCDWIVYQIFRWSKSHGSCTVLQRLRCRFGKKSVALFSNASLLQNPLAPVRLLVHARPAKPQL